MNRKSSRKVLHVTGSLELNGLTSVAMNYYRNIDSDSAQFDFAIFKDNIDPFLEDEITTRGGNIFNLGKNNKTKNSFMDIPLIAMNFYKLFKNNKYDVIHSHTIYVSGIVLMIAWLFRIPVRIVHSHNDNAGENGVSLVRVLSRHIEKLLIILFATNKFACSKKSALYLYGKKCFGDRKVTVINNAIDLERFKAPNKELNSDEDSIQFIFIGRFDPQKNPLFLIRVFNELNKLNNKTRLTLIGTGLLEREMKNLVSELNINDKVSFIKPNNKIPEYLSKMHFFILPSLYEGLPVVLVEAQAMGLPCFISEEITDETNLGLCNFIPLDIGEMGWAQIINNLLLTKKYKKEIDKTKLEEFNIKNVVRKLDKIYNYIT
ncbi:glycosyltransferase [Paenibacillus apii]|uniref:glycosyltransferase n=1 Tax=Paenibacillus apii TaxID=1850370 RepID=UPI001439A313|nr:glycosyltransferase [Paenibacillus apii]NJJ41639.1 glycosyltransferase family 1 protein [Paenibacillus apii]